MKPLLALFLFTLSAAAQHAHYAAGVQDVNGNNAGDPGEPLAFIGANGTDKTFHLLAQPVGNRPTQRCGGFYMLDERPRTLHAADAFSFTVLSDGTYDVPHPLHPHTGAWVWMEIVSVTGPAGGQFGFWDENRSFSFDTPTVSFAANQPTGNYRFVLSEGFDEAGEDPQGHIHGRSWTATKPGDYYIGMRLVDRSTNRPGGGPWHPPSQVYIYHFKAGPSFQPQMQATAGGPVTLTWASEMGHWASDPAQYGITFQIERATTLAPANWQTIGSVVGTTAPTATFTDFTPPTGNAFYRLKFNWGAAGPIGASQPFPKVAVSKTGGSTKANRSKPKLTKYTR
jgi:hypothetical protein